MSSSIEARAFFTELADLPRTHKDLFDGFALEKLGTTDERRELNASLLDLMKIAATQRVNWSTLLLSGAFYSGLMKEAFGAESIIAKLVSSRESWKRGDKDAARESIESAVGQISRELELATLALKGVKR